MLCVVYSFFVAMPLAAAAEPLASDVPKKLSGTVLEVTAGDEFIVLARNTRYKILLDAVAAPLAGQPFSDEAREALERMLLGRTVEVTCVRGSRSNGIVGRVWLDSQSINKQVIEQGWAWYDPSAVKSAALAAAQQAAREQTLGLWQGDDPVAPWEWRQRVADTSGAAAETDAPMPSEGTATDATPPDKQPPVEAVAREPPEAAGHREDQRPRTTAEPEAPETNERPPRDARRGNPLIRLPTPAEARRIEQRYQEERRRRNAGANRPQAPSAMQRRPSRSKDEDAAPAETAEAEVASDPKSADESGSTAATPESDQPAESVADTAAADVAPAGEMDSDKAIPQSAAEEGQTDLAADAPEPVAGADEMDYATLRQDFDAQYAAFAKLRDDSPNGDTEANADPRGEFASKFFELAESKRGSEEALEPLVAVCELSAAPGTQEAVGKAVARLREDHLEAPQLAEAVRLLCQSSEYDPSEFFEALSSESPHQDVKGIALYNQAAWLARGEIPKESIREIDNILIKVVLSYRNVPYLDSTLGEHAEQLSEAIHK